MNRKFNTILFVLMGTIVNVILMLIILMLLLYISSLFFTESTDHRVVSAIILTDVMFSVLASYLVYSRGLKIINKKWNLEKWIEPLFNRKK